MTHDIEINDAMFGYPAWRGFVAWAIKHPDFRAEFTKATGLQWPAPPKNGFDAMIDKATGVHETVREAFVLWVTEHHWGLDDAPPAVREAVEAARAKA